MLSRFYFLVFSLGTVLLGVAETSSSTSQSASGSTTPPPAANSTKSSSDQDGSSNTSSSKPEDAQAKSSAHPEADSHDRPHPSATKERAFANHPPSPAANHSAPGMKENERIPVPNRHVVVRPTVENPSTLSRGIPYSSSLTARTAVIGGPTNPGFKAASGVLNGTGLKHKGASINWRTPRVARKAVA